MHPSVRQTDLILGTAQLCGTYGAVGRPSTRRSAEQAEAFLRRAVALGFSAIDTAPAYDDAEVLIGRSGVQVAVHTKIDSELEPGASVRRSLDRLRRDRVEVLYFHDPEIAVCDRRGLVSAARELVGTRVDRLGVSVYTERELRAALSYGRFDASQIPLSILDRRIDDATLAGAAAAGMRVVARSAFLQGLILTPAPQIPARLRPLAPYVEAVHALAREAAISVPALALGWVKRRPGIAGIVVGAHDERELEELATAWAEAPLNEAVAAACAALPSPPSEWCDPRRWPPEESQ